MVQITMQYKLKVKQFVWSILTSSLVGQIILRFYGDYIPSNGMKIFIPSSIFSPKMAAKVFWGFYEKSEIILLEKYLHSDIDIIELGSSIGVVSSHIARKMQMGNTLICVEANPDIIPILKENLAINAANLEPIIINAAISSTTAQEINLFVGNTHTASNVFFAKHTYRKVPVTTLTQICDQYQIHDFALVCDIEGSEWEILAYEPSALNHCRQIIIELHPYNALDKQISVRDMEQFLVSELAFTIVHRRGNVFVFEKEG